MFTDAELELIDRLLEEFCISGDAEYWELKLAYTIQEKVEKALNG